MTARSTRYSAQGVSLARQSRAALLAALGIAIITMITLGYLKPYGRYAYQSMVFAIKNAAFQAFAGRRIHETRRRDFPEGVRAGAFSTVFLYESNDGASTALTARNDMLLRSGDQPRRYCGSSTGFASPFEETLAERSHRPDKTRGRPASYGSRNYV